MVAQRPIAVRVAQMVAEGADDALALVRRDLESVPVRVRRPAVPAPAEFQVRARHARQGVGAAVADGNDGRRVRPALAPAFRRCDVAQRLPHGRWIVRPPGQEPAQPRARRHDRQIARDHLPGGERHRAAGGVHLRHARVRPQIGAVRREPPGQPFHDASREERPARAGEHARRPLRHRQVRAEALDARTVEHLVRDAEVSEGGERRVRVVARPLGYGDRAGVHEVLRAEVGPDAFPGGEGVEHHARVAPGGAVMGPDHAMVVEGGGARIGDRPLFQQHGLVSGAQGRPRHREPDDATADDHHTRHGPTSHLWTFAAPPILSGIARPLSGGERRGAAENAVSGAASEACSPPSLYGSSGGWRGGRRIWLDTEQRIRWRCGRWPSRTCRRRRPCPRRWAGRIGWRIGASSTASAPVWRLSRVARWSEPP